MSPLTFMQVAPFRHGGGLLSQLSWVSPGEKEQRRTSSGKPPHKHDQNLFAIVEESVHFKPSPLIKLFT